MILTVTPNPALDLTYHVDALEIGETHRVDAARSRAGGKGLNVARVVHQTGNAALALAPLGGATGREFERELKASGVPHALVPVSISTRRSVAIVDALGGETTILNERGEALAPADWHTLVDAAARLADDADCIVGSGSLPPDAPADFYANLVRLARDRGLPSIIDATGPALLKAAQAGASVLKPNRLELADSTGESDPVVGARRLIEFGAGIVLVSLGADGMICVTADAAAPVVRARLASPLVGNPTGAGDAGVAAVAVALVTGESDPALLLRHATAWSAAAVLMPVAGEISESYRELEAQLVIDRF
jgi:1-phosphofructokinase family hexose kinase